MSNPTADTTCPPSQLKDTTLRSVIFNKKCYAIKAGPKGGMFSFNQKIIDPQVSSALFNTYDHVLKIMAQLSRLIYCDSGILREVLKSNEFGTNNNKAVNNKITEKDNEFYKLRKLGSTYSESKESRPMQSYVITPTEGDPFGRPAPTAPFAQYISSPSDLTLLLLSGNFLKAKQPFFTENDLIIAFKGSSTVKNFQHDIYSQFTRGDLSTLMPPGTKMSSSSPGRSNIVTNAFVYPILESWDQLKQGIEVYKPTRLFITGHSLGGAYASLFTFIMAEIRAANFPFITSIHNITFGAPTLLADGARNTFNEHLDSGNVTLDRVSSNGVFGVKVFPDIIPSLPIGFSHPGFQPLKTELYPEAKTARAYNYDTIRKVFVQSGGFSISTGAQKSLYIGLTMTHMPNKIEIPVNNILTRVFSHAEYFDMTFIKGFRVGGMKNPGFLSAGKSYTFVANLYDSGIKFNYIVKNTKPGSIVAEEPTDETADMTKVGPPPASATAAPANNAATRQNRRRQRSNRKTQRRRR
jgi:hypothetical protein